ncbi:MAG TPA: winged helix-turn-helix domain-containing protein [Candidatus Thermoplasmatota archaeon]|nr:winged helix-turn-helix domain-containing protein [Candidatus Thermoplasmatota archaeon]
MGDGAFDIYQTNAGYAAVTSPVQRQILDALREGEKQLPELVEITGRSKPTLSSLHMKELLARELIEEAIHPTDSRRKVYRLRATKIGSSELPVAQLRDAVQHYVSLSPLSPRLPLAATFEALAAAPEGTAADILHAQGQRLGTMAAPLFKAATVRDLWMRVSSFLESEKVATSLRIDLQHGWMDLKLGATVQGRPACMAAVLAGFVAGVAEGKALDLRHVQGSTVPDGIRLTGR